MNVGRAKRLLKLQAEDFADRARDAKKVPMEADFELLAEALKTMRNGQEAIRAAETQTAIETDTSA